MRVCGDDGSKDHTINGLEAPIFLNWINIAQCLRWDGACLGLVVELLELFYVVFLYLYY